MTIGWESNERQRREVDKNTNEIKGRYEREKGK
jgi:hypothetical protein